MVDAQRLRQIVSNGLTNAMKYATGATCISLSCATAGGAIAFSVEDDGPGLPHGVTQEDLFAEFTHLASGAHSGRPAVVVRDTTTVDSPVHSTGLGLPIANR